MVECSSVLINAIGIGNGVPIFNETHMGIKSRKLQNFQYKLEVCIGNLTESH